MEPFPPLPVELVRCILEIAAEENRHFTSLELVCLSKLVYKWITPILYRSVIIETENQVYSFKDAICAHGRHVRRLCLSVESSNWSGADDDRIFADIVCGCPRLEVLYATVDMVAEVTENTSFPGPWMMVLELTQDVPPPGHPLLRNITHLWLDYLNETFTSLFLSLPHLTHIGINCYGDGDSAGQQEYISFIHRLLSSPSLRILLLCAFYPDGIKADELFGERWDEIAKIEDVRLLVMEGVYKDDHMNNVYDEEPTLWDGAEDNCKDWRETVGTSASESESESEFESESP